MAVEVASNRADADELFSDVLGIAVEKLPARLKNPHGWFRRVLTNTWADTRRRRCRETRLLVDLAGKELVLLEGPSAFDEVARKQASEELLEALDRLPEEERDVVCRTELRDQEIKSVALQLGISPRTVQRRKESGMRRLVELLQDADGRQVGCLGVLLQGIDWERTLQVPAPSSAAKLERTVSAPVRRIAPQSIAAAVVAVGGLSAFVAYDALYAESSRSRPVFAAETDEPSFEIDTPLVPATEPDPGRAVSTDISPELSGPLGEEVEPPGLASESSAVPELPPIAAAPPCTFELELWIDGQRAPGWVTNRAYFDGRAPVDRRRVGFKNEIYGEVEGEPGLYRWSLPDAPGEWRITLARDAGSRVGDQRAFLALFRLVPPDASSGGPLRERIDLTTASFAVEISGAGARHPGGKLKTFQHLGAATWLQVSPSLESTTSRWIYGQAFEGDYRFGMPENSLDPDSWHLLGAEIRVAPEADNVFRFDSSAFTSCELWPKPPKASPTIQLEPGVPYRPK